MLSFSNKLSNTFIHNFIYIFLTRKSQWTWHQNKIFLSFKRELFSKAHVPLLLTGLCYNTFYNLPLSIKRHCDFSFNILCCLWKRSIWNHFFLQNLCRSPSSPLVHFISPNFLQGVPVNCGGHFRKVYLFIPNNVFGFIPHTVTDVL